MLLRHRQRKSIPAGRIASDPAGASCRSVRPAMRPSMRTGDPNQIRCRCGVALKCKPPRNRRLKTKTPLSPGALPAARIVGKPPSFCAKLNHQSLSSSFARIARSRESESFSVPIARDQSRGPVCARPGFVLARLTAPAAREKRAEKGAMNPERHSHRAHRPARASGNRLGGGRIMPFGEDCQIAADIRKRRLRQHPARRRCEYAVRVQELARQVEPLSPRICGEITKSVGELQRPAQFRRDTLALRASPRRRCAPRAG